MTLALVITGIVLLEIFTQANIRADFSLPVTAQLALLAAGVTVVGAAGFRPRQSKRVPDNGIFAALVIVLLVAFALRWIDLGTALQRHMDELHPVRAVVQTWDDPQIPILVPYDGIPAFTRVYAVGQVWGVDVLGADLAGLRYISVLFGVLTVAATYALGRQLFDDRRVALLGAVVLAAFPPHLHFSRIGLNNIADPFFGTMAFVFLLRGLRQHDLRIGHFLAAGACLGLTQMFYEGGRLLFPPVALATITTLLLVKRYRRHWRGAVALMVAAVIVAAPVYRALNVNESGATPRLDATTSGLLDDGLGGAVSRVLSNLDDSIGLLLASPDPGWFYAGNTALILPWLVPFALVGLIWIVMRLRSDVRLWLLVWWLLAAVMGNTLMQTVEAPRFVVVFPVLALLIGAGLVLCVNVLRVQNGWLLIVSASVLIVGQAIYYFGGHLPAYITAFPEQGVVDDVRFRARTLPDNTHVQVIAPVPVFDVDEIVYMQFAGRHDDGVFIEYRLPGSVTGDRWTVEAQVRNLALFVPPDDTVTQALIESTFPDVAPQLSPLPDLRDQTYWLYFIPRG